MLPICNSELIYLQKQVPHFNNFGYQKYWALSPRLVMTKLCQIRFINDATIIKHPLYEQQKQVIYNLKQYILKQVDLWSAKWVKIVNYRADLIKAKYVGYNLWHTIQNLKTIKEVYCRMNYPNTRLKMFNAELNNEPFVVWSYLTRFGWL